MAELTEKDKRTLWGENYKEVLAKAQEEGRVQACSRTALGIASRKVREQ